MRLKSYLRYWLLCYLVRFPVSAFSHSLSQSLFEWLLVMEMENVKKIRLKSSANSPLKNLNSVGAKTETMNMGAWGIRENYCLSIVNWYEYELDR